MTSLRRQLHVSLLTTLCLVLVATGVLLHGLLADALAEGFDTALATKARSLGALMEADGPYVEFDYNRALLPEFAQDDYFQLWVQGGETFCRSDSLGQDDLPRRTAPLARPEVFDLVLPDGRPARGLGVVIDVVEDDEPGPGPRPPRMDVVVARPREALDDSLARLDTSLALAGALALGLLALGVSRAVRRSLRPVTALGERVAAVEVATLGTPLDAGDTPDELAPFVRKLDELMTRLAAAFERQQRMIDAMAHELRTPVAELRSASDVARTWPQDDDLAEALAETSAAVAARMSAAIEAILHTSRLQAGADRVDRERVSLAALVHEHVEPWEPRATARKVVFEVRIDPDLVVTTDRRLLGLVLSNLLANAASFSDPGRVVISADRAADGWELVVENPAAGLSPEDAGRLAEPFWRRDAARTGERHSGLGLSLVVAILSNLDGRLELVVSDGILRARVRVTGPSPSHHEPPGGGT